MHSIYLITLNNGKQYCGYTSRSHFLRCREHIKNAKNGVKSRFYNSMRKHGFKSIEIIDRFDTEFKALMCEIMYIATHTGLLNSTNGGEGNTITIETKRETHGTFKYRVVQRKGGKPKTKRNFKPRRQRRRRR